MNLQKKQKNLESSYQAVHGVLIKVNKIGVLLMGKSNIGKSTLALELISRGHSLIADDIVYVKFNTKSQKLIGKPHKLLKKLINVRGLGLLNIHKLFGKDAFKKNASINLIIELIDFIPEKYLNNLEIKFEKTFISHYPILSTVIPITIKNHLPLYIETVVRQYDLLYRKDYNTLVKFNQKQQLEMNKF